MKTAVFVVTRVTVLTIILFICFAVAGGLVAQDTSQSSAAAALPLLAVCLVQAAVVTYLVLRSHWTGWRLVAAVFVVFYGVTTFMAQIESTVFLTHLPQGMLPRLFLMGAVIAAPFSVAAVLILGKRTGNTPGIEQDSRLVMPASEWAWKLAVIAVFYVMLYFTFGYFIAWRNPAVPEYYGSVDEGSFVSHMRIVLRDTPWLVPFQILRGTLWAALALLVIRLMKGEWLETALIVALLFGPVMTAPLILANPYMPEAVRMAHLRETTSSNFIFGMFITWLLAGHRTFRKKAVMQGTA